jgi:hypothetical protein
VSIKRIMSLATNNIFAALDAGAKKSKPKVEKDVSKKKKSTDDKDKKAATAELEKAIFAQPLSSSNWADDSEDDDDYAAPPVDDGWSRVPASYHRATVHKHQIL